MTQYSTPTQADTLARARSGDQQAIEELMAAFLYRARPLAWSFAQSSGLEVDDLLQNVALRMWRHWSDILSTNNPYPYASIVARRCLIDQYAKVARRRRIVRMMPLEEAWV